jgi:diacylglycerol kinase family enzyme
MLLNLGPLETKTIDVGRFNKRYFIVRISIGFEADIIKGANHQTKNKIGIFAYFLSAAAELKKTRKTVYHLKIDGQEHKIQGLACIITNTGNLGFSKISFDKHIDISVYSSPQQAIQCDGEVLEKAPLHIKIIPGAIKVLVPKKIVR